MRSQSPRWEKIVGDLCAGVDAGRLLVPLSASHYLELWHRRDHGSREAVGSLMRDVTGYVTSKPVQTIRQLEVDASVDRFVTSDERWVGTSDVFAHGVAHAFGSKYGRLRFVESIETSDCPEGPQVPAPQQFDELELAGENWEWFQLVGVQEISESEGIDRTPEHLRGDRYVDQELALRAELERDPALRRRLADLILTQEIVDLTEEINNTCKVRHIHPHALFLEHPAGVEPPEAMRRFVSGLPSVDVLTTLRLWKHRNLTHPWEQHDKMDLMALTVAVPYCDVVITERQWSHLVNVSGLARRYNTIVGYGVAALEEALRLSRAA